MINVATRQFPEAPGGGEWIIAQLLTYSAGGAVDTCFGTR